MTLPELVTPENKAKKLNEAVSSLRQGRDAELEALRKSRAAGGNTAKLFSKDGKLLSPTSTTAAADAELEALRKSRAAGDNSAKLFSKDGKLIGSTASATHTADEAELEALRKSRAAGDTSAKLFSKDGKLMGSHASMHTADEAELEALRKSRAAGGTSAKLFSKDGKLMGSHASAAKADAAELEALRKSRAAGDTSAKLFSKDGKLVGSSTSTAAEWAHKQHEERLAELSRTVEHSKHHGDGNGTNSKGIGPTATSSTASFSYDYRNADYKGFLFAVHPTEGLLLLHCTRKLQKGPHFQLPGGHVDDHEFASAARILQEESEGNDDPQEQLLLAAKMGTAREFYEEVGIDLRNSLDRLQPAPIRLEAILEKGAPVLTCELKKRLYFFVELEDSDFWDKKKVDAKTIKKLGLRLPMGKGGSKLMARLSEEHSNFAFEKDPRKAAELIKKHSGGKNTTALLMAMENYEVRQKRQNSAGGASSTMVGQLQPPVDQVVTFDVSKIPAPAVARVQEEKKTERKKRAGPSGDAAEDLVLPSRKEQKGLFSCLDCLFQK